MHIRENGEMTSLKSTHSEDIELSDNGGVTRFRELKKQANWKKIIEPQTQQIIELESVDWAKLFLFINNNSMIKTVLQKSLFLFNMRSGLPKELFSWKPDKYGPYSLELENKIRYSKDIKKERQSNKYKGFTYKYHLENPTRVESMWKDLPPKVKKLISEIVSEIKTLESVKKIENFVHDAYPKYAVNALC